LIYVFLPNSNLYPISPHIFSISSISYLTQLTYVEFWFPLYRTSHSCIHNWVGLDVLGSLGTRIRRNHSNTTRVVQIGLLISVRIHHMWMWVVLKVMLLLLLLWLVFLLGVVVGQGLEVLGHLLLRLLLLQHCSGTIGGADGTRFADKDHAAVGQLDGGVGRIRRTRHGHTCGWHSIQICDRCYQAPEFRIVILAHAQLAVVLVVSRNTCVWR